jgi:hypothetical protein
VYYERTGHVKPRELVERCREMMPPGESLEPVVVEPHKLSNEVGAALIRAQNEKLKPEGKYVVQATVVLDCEGMSMGHFYSPALDLMKANSTMDQKYAPEGMHKCYVVNAPTFIKIGWNMIRLWIDARSQAKVVFVSPGEPTRQALVEAIGEDNLPEYLGGKCCCEGGCVRDVEAHEDLGGDVTVELAVPARGSKTHVVPVPKGSKVSYKWTSANGNDCGFHVFFKSVEDAELDTVAANESDPSKLGFEVVPSVRAKEAANDDFVALADGYVTLRFDNSFSWMKGKTIHLRVSTSA